MTEEQVLKIRINPAELAFITGLTLEESKVCFEFFADRKVIYDHTTATISNLKRGFSEVRSLDKRWDKMNQLVFAMLTKSECYKEYLNYPIFINSGRLDGGKSILLKIMSEEQKRHLYSVRKQKYNQALEELKLF